MLYFWAMNTKATGVGGINDPDGEADRSAAENPTSGTGLEPATCPRERRGPF